MSTDDAAFENYRLNLALAEMGDIWVTGLRKQLNVPEDWIYRSGYILTKIYNSFVDHVGTNNVVFVTGHKRPGGVMRYSIFISPEGIKRVKTWNLERDYN